MFGMLVCSQDYPSSQTEVTLERMSVDEEYQADTVYGESPALSDSLQHTDK